MAVYRVGGMNFDAFLCVCLSVVVVLVSCTDKCTFDAYQLRSHKDWWKSQPKAEGEKTKPLLIPINTPAYAM